MRMLIAMLATLSLLACNRETAAEASSAAPAGGPPAITFDGDAVDIAYGGQRLRGETRDSGKRKYTVDGGAVSYEIKPNEEGGFKLRTAGGKLLWKVKVTADKVKISNNEENENPFELKVRDGNRVKVVAPGDKELGNVRFDGAKVDVEDAAGQTRFTIASAKPAGAYGVLLLDAIPQQERVILIAELLSRGR